MAPAKFVAMNVLVFKTILILSIYMSLVPLPHPVCRHRKGLCVGSLFLKSVRTKNGLSLNAFIFKFCHCVRVITVCALIAV